ncbi:MAG: hypothetical protein KGS72_09060 [Cyanobacteria bacterium REEB67]|nr:hypothetical protein [Cyanobacteria bacterium REEB67]
MQIQGVSEILKPSDGKVVPEKRIEILAIEITFRAQKSSLGGGYLTVSIGDKRFFAASRRAKKHNIDDNLFRDKIDGSHKSLTSGRIEF